MNERWQNDWSSFVDQISDRVTSGATSESPGEAFGGETVQWEGVLKKKSIDKLSASVTIGLPQKTVVFPGGRTVTLNGVSLPVADEAVAEWSELEVGASVRFAAVLGSRLSVFPPIEIKELPTGTLVVMVRLTEGRVA